MRLLFTFLRDLKLSVRSFYFYIEFVMAVIIVAIMMLAVPENFDSSITVYAHIDAPSSVTAAFKDLLGDDEALDIIFVDSAQAVEEKMKKDSTATGLLLGFEDDKAHYTFVLQGYESEKARHVMEANITYAQIEPLLDEQGEGITVQTLAASEKRLSDRVEILPMLLVFNSAFIGLFIITSYVFLDKKEGTIRAMVVTPSTVWHYVISKMGIMLMTSLITGSFIALVISGGRVALLPFLVLLACSNLLGSAIGLLIGSFFETLMQSFGSLYVVIVVLALSGVSYFMPSFSPLPVRLLPSYPMLFAFRETLLDQPDYAYIFGWSGIFFLLTAILVILSGLRYKKTITL